MILKSNTTNPHLTIIIKDDGKGFDIKEVSLTSKWGLINMQQEAESMGGKLVIDSIPSRGTEISVNIPLKRKEV